MRLLVWVCRVILFVVVGAFVATVFSLIHRVGTDMDSAKLALDLVTVIGAGLLGLIWPLMRRYWQALLLLIGLGVVRGLFGADPGLSTLETPLLTPFQSDYIWISIGVTGFFLIATLATRAITSDRKLRALRKATTIATPAQVVTSAASVTEVRIPDVQPVTEVIQSAEPEVAAADQPPVTEQPVTEEEAPAEK